jgi:hypothetical protein
MNRSSLTKTSFLLAAALGALLPFSCSKEPAAPSCDPIEFSLDGPSTKGKAAITSLAALAAQDFSVSAWYSSKGMSFHDEDGAQAIPYVSNSRFGYIKVSGEDNSYANHTWQGVNRNGNNLSARPVYWPLDGTLSFFCYAPYRADAAAATPPDPDTRDIVLEAPVTDAGIISRLPGYLPGSPLIRVSPMLSAPDQVDFLAAPPLLDRRRTDGAFPLDFSAHRMTRVEFMFNETGFVYPTGTVPEGEEIAVRVTAISLRNVVGSKYLYFTEPLPGLMDCAWSGDVSPADPATAGAGFPRATFRIAGENRELKTIAQYNARYVNVPERNAANDNHIGLQTNQGILFLLPQRLPDDAELEVCYALVEQHGLPVVSEIVTCSLPLTSLDTWPEGKVVRYKITLNVPARSVSDVVAQAYDWDDSGNDHNEELMPHD